MDGPRKCRRKPEGVNPGGLRRGAASRPDKPQR